MANISAIKLPNGTTYTLKDNGALQLTGGQVTGPVTFGDSVSIDSLTAGDLVVNGSASFTNNIQANTINGVTVGNSPKFTDTNTEVSTLTLVAGSTAGTSLTSGGKFTLTAGSKTVSFTMPTIPTIPSNNITGSGTSGKVVKFTGTNTIGDGWGVTDNSSSTAVTSTDTNLITARTLYYAGYTKNIGTITSVKTTAGKHTTINVSSGAANFNVPTATSHLTNDSGYLTSATLPIHIIEIEYYQEDNGKFIYQVTDSTQTHSVIKGYIDSGEIVVLSSGTERWYFQAYDRGISDIVFSRDNFNHHSYMWADSNLGNTYWYCDESKSYLTLATLPIYDGTVV